MTTGLKRFVGLGLLALSSWMLAGCQEEITATVEGDLIPVEAITVEISLPYEEFAEDLEAWGGYGRPWELSRHIVANQYQGSLDARVLNAWGRFPLASTVRDTTGVFVSDSTLTFVQGRIIARFDTLASVLEDSVTLAVTAVPRLWDYRSAGWEVAVDSVGDRQFWEEPGAGPGTQLDTKVWNPAAGDSVVFEIDSAGVALWADSVDHLKGVRLDVVTEGTRLELRSLGFSVTARPSVNPDTLVELAVSSQGRTFIYQPVPEAPGGEIRVGGVPAWRSVFEVDMPKTLNGPEELCQVVQCPLELTPESLVSASLVLTTRATPPAFQPSDTLLLDVRPVLEPTRLPKSPLGQSLIGITPVFLSPDDFGEGAGTEIEIPLGSYIERIIAENAGEDIEVPRTLALLSAFEPLSLVFVSFEGPESPDKPELRLIMTFADAVQIR